MCLVTFLHYFSFQAYSKLPLLVSSFTNLNITHLQLFCIQPNSLYKKVMNDVCSYFLHYYSFQAYSMKAFIVLSFCQFKYYTFTILLFSTQLSVDYIWRKSWIMFLVTFLHYYSFQAYSKSALIVSSFMNFNITHFQFFLYSTQLTVQKSDELCL